MFSTIEQLWREFRARVAPRGAPEDRRREMRRAFYAGFYALLTELRRMGDAVPDEAGVAQLQAWTGEALAFYRDVKAGRA